MQRLRLVDPGNQIIANVEHSRFRPSVFQLNIVGIDNDVTIDIRLFGTMSGEEHQHTVLFANIVAM